MRTATKAEVWTCHERGSADGHESGRLALPALALPRKAPPHRDPLFPVAKRGYGAWVALGDPDRPPCAAPEDAPDMPIKSRAFLSLTMPRGGWGVAETGAAAATAGASKAEEVRQGLQTEARVREQLDAAAHAAAEQRKAVDSQ